MKVSNKILIIFSIFLILMLIIPSSFATESDTILDDANSTVNSLESSVDSTILVYSDDSISNTNSEINVESADSDSNSYYNKHNYDNENYMSDNTIDINKKDFNSLSSGVGSDEGISIDSDTVTLVEGKKAYITGVLYWSGIYGGSVYEIGAELSYSYVGDNGQTITGTFDSDDYGDFSLDLSRLSNLSPRDSPYIFTLSCEDEWYYDLNDEIYPDSTTVNVYVVFSSVDPIVYPSIYVSKDGNDETGDGSEENPYFTIEKAVSVANEANAGYEIKVKEGVYTLSSQIANGNNLTITGLGDVVFDLDNQSYGFDTRYVFTISNIKFINAYGSSSGSGFYAAIKSTSSWGEALIVNNCTFVNCIGGAITTYYGGKSVLTVNNCTFINCSSNMYGGAISVSYSEIAKINYSVFINCSAYNGGAISFYNSDGGSSLNNCIFINNNASNLGGIIYARGSNNLENNYWGSNLKPNSTLVSSASSINNWVILDINADLSKVAVDDVVEFTFDLTKYTDGESNFTLETPLNDISFFLTSDLGRFENDSVTLLNGIGKVNYTALNSGTETVRVNFPPIANEISFDVIGPESDVIYVSNNGSDTEGRGTESLPYKTIEMALTKVTDNRNTIYIKKGTYNEHDLIISKDLTIIGEDMENTIIDANENGRIFIISSEISVEIKSLSLINGKPDYSDDDFYGQGGAILLDNGKLLLNKTIISNSKASAGGAIAVIGYASSSLTVLDSSFIANSLDGDASLDFLDIIGGGAIFSNSKLIINNTVFKANQAICDDGDNDGGALYIGQSAIIENSIFINNKVGLNGGAIYISAYNNSNVNIENNIFESNLAKNGGAIYSSMSNLTSILNNQFNYNNASSNGGGIFIDGLKSKDLIRNNNFTENEADYGGAISIKNAEIVLLNNIMGDNSANVIGSSIYINGGKINANLTFLENSTVTISINDSAELFAKLSDDMGNPIANANVSFNLAGEDIASAISDDEGMAKVSYTTDDNLGFYLLNGSFTQMSDSYPSNIRAGVLEISKYYWFIGDKSYFTLQDAVDDAEEGDIITGLPGIYSYEEVHIGSRMGLIYKNLTIKADNLGDIILSGKDGRLFNVADKHAYNDEHRPSALKLINIIIENSTDEYGGAIYVGSRADLRLENCIFRNNQGTNPDSGSKWHGGVIMSWGNLFIDNCTFINNSATSGGAINTENIYGGDVIITNTFFIDNHVEDTGGAIYTADNGIILIENCSFINNSGGYGGAIYDYANLTLINSEFANNTASYAGGAIYSRDNLLADNISVEGSSAEFGGALYLSPRISRIIIGDEEIYDISIFNIINSRFDNNMAREDGGVIFEGYNSVSIGYIDNCNFTNSIAGNGGGAIYNYYSNCTISNSRFVNSSANYGGALYAYGYYDAESTVPLIYPAYFIVNNSEFDTNIAEVNGGAILLDDEYVYLFLDNSIFTNSKAGKYGGVIFSNGTVVLSNNSMYGPDASFGKYIYNNFSISNPNLTFLNNDTIIYNLNDGSEFNISVFVCDDMENPISGKAVIFYINESYHSLEIDLNDGYGIYSYEIKAIGDYLISGAYTGALNDEFTVETGVLSVYKPNLTELVISSEDLYVGDDLIIRLIDSNNNSLANFTVNVKMDSSDINLTTDSNGEIIISELRAGRYDLTCEFAGDSNYDHSIIEKTIKVNKYDSEISFNLNKNDLIISLLNGTNPISDKNLSINVIDGEGQIRRHDLSTDSNGNVNIFLTKGQYFVLANFTGDDFFINSSYSDKLIVNPIEIRINITVGENGTVYVNEIFDVEVDIIDGDGKGINDTVSLSFNGKDYNITIADGKGSTRIDPVSVADTYPFTLFYFGDSLHDSQIIYLDLDVKERNESDSNIRGAKDIQELIDNASPGSIINLGNYTYIDVCDVNITKDISIVSDGALIIGAGDASIFNIPSISSGGPKSVNISNIEFKLSNNDVIVSAIADNGSSPLSIDVAQITISNNTISKLDDSVVSESLTVMKLTSERGILAPSNRIEIIYNTLDSGIETFKFDVVSFNNDSNVHVPVGGNIPSRIGTKILYENMVTYAINTNIDGRIGKYFNVTLVDSNNNPLANKLVQIGFNGKIYNKTTNESGGVSLQINLGSKGIYTFAISFLGDDVYNASFEVSKINVTQQKAKLTTSKKTYKAADKTKTLTASFKTLKGNPIANKKITFTVNGKTYSANTNSKGVATVKVSLSAKKTYSFTAKYAGDSKYAAVSVKSTVVIK